MGESVRERCLGSTVIWRGTMMAADMRFEIYYDGGYIGGFYASPDMIEEAIIGFLLLKGETRAARIEGIRELGDLDRSVEVSFGSERLRIPEWGEAKIQWDRIMELLSDLSEAVPKSGCPFAFHMAGLYLIDGTNTMKAIVIDVSRHTAIMKIAGWVVRRADGLSGKVPVVVSTGRISGDMIRVLSLVKVGIVASMRHVLVSGVVAAEQSGITLIAKDYTRRLKVFTHPWRVPDGPRVPEGGPLVRWEGRKVEDPIC